MRTSIAASMVLALLGTARLASAQAPSLEWHAPTSCPDAASMQARVSRLLTHGAATTEGSFAEGTVEQRGDRFVLHLELRIAGRHATRSLEANDCANLSDAAAWLVAGAVDPNLPEAARDELTKPEQAQPPAQPETKPSDTPPSPAPPDATTASAKPTNPSDEPAADDHTAHAPYTWRGRAGLFGGVFAAGLAGPAGSLGGQLGAEHGPILLDVQFAHQFSRTLGLGGGASSVLSSQQLGAQGCFMWGVRSRFGACADVSLLRIRGEARGIAKRQGATFWTGGAGLSVLGTQRLYGPLELWLNAGLFLPVVRRPQFQITGIGDAGKAALLGGTVRLGVALVLP